MDKNKEKNTINITIRKETKAHLDVQRKATQIDLYISLMLQYFSTTGINPRSSIHSEYPERMLKRMEDIMRVIKAIEKNRIIPINDKLEQIASKIELKDVNTSPTHDDEDIELIIAQNQRLMSELEKTKKLLKSEKRINEQLNQRLSFIDTDFTKSMLKKIREKLKEICTPAMFDNTMYLIEKSGMHSAIQMVEELSTNHKHIEEQSQ